MQCGVHLFFALLLCHLVPKRKQWGARAGLFRYGLVLGAILPDIDLPVAVLMVAITRDADQADVYHRTCTHSLAFLAVSAVLFIGLAKWVEGLVDRTPSLRFLTQSLHGEQHHKRASRRKTTPQQAVFDSAAFGGGLCIGILSHILLDMLYMKNVAVLWPMTYEGYGWPLLGFWTQMNPLVVKLVETTDHYTDLALFLVPMLAISSRHRLDPKRHAAALKYCFVKALIMAPLVALAFHEGMSFETFFVLLYIPGTIFFTISVLLPVFFRDAIALVGDEP